MMITPLSKAFEICAGLKVGSGSPLLIISGPCQIESFDHCQMLAEKLKAICAEFSANFIFKASFDKANRTSLSGTRGVGLDQGLRILERVRKECAVPVITDIHSAEQAISAAQVVDVLQIPAFLCRQTDLLVAAGNTNKTVNIKKGQFLAPEDMRFAAEKVAASGNHKLMLCERGSCFGYRDLVVDMRGMLSMANLAYPVIYDATHSVQVMGGQDGASHGKPQFIAPLARAAISLGIDGVFVECHEEPARAPSDSASMLPLSQMRELVRSLTSIYNCLRQ